TLSFWQGEAEPCAFAQFAFDVNCSPLLFHQALRDGYSQASSFFYAPRRFTHLAEFLKDHLLIFFANTHAVVTDDEIHESTFSGTIDSYVSALRCELQRITQQVVKDLL